MVGGMVLPEQKSPKAAPDLACEVFLAADLRVTLGVNHGDAIGDAEAAVAGDVYRLRPDAIARRLGVHRGDGSQRVAQGSAAGRAGAAIALVARHTLMAPDGDRVQVLVLRQDDPAEEFALPLSPIGVRIDYTLVLTEDAPDDAALADIFCVSFVRGTAITLGGGAQVAIERLEPGMRILTRDHGPQPLRWLGRASLRGLGVFAPVVIGAGTYGNTGDLVVSQHHRIFLYLRDRAPQFARAELLVQARHLVDGDAVYLRPGGTVDYFSLVFDRHEIVYAEGIPAESLMVNEATLAHLPPDLAAEVAAAFPGVAHAQHIGLEAGRDLARTLGVSRRGTSPGPDG